MRRTLLCCALLALTLGACSSSMATPGGYNYPAPAATMAYATQAPIRPWSTVAPIQPAPPVGYPSPGLNPYVDTSSDAVSTFGLDVDTASYTVARAYVARGLTPDRDTVRPEEWVNYFDQGYAAPESQAFAIHTDGGPTPFLSSNEVLLRIGVKAREASEGLRSPMALTLVIDVSGSMGDDNKLVLVQDALAMLVSQLRGSDRVAIVAFSTEARVVLGPTSGADKERILDAIRSLHPENSTNAEAGLLLGYQLAHQQKIEEGVNRVVLATDGVANVGSVSASQILSEVGANAGSGIQLVAVGVGMGTYNDALLEQLADKGEGYYAYVDTPDEARRIFVDDLVSTMQTVALDGKAQIQFDPDQVTGYRLIGYEDRVMPDSSFRSSSAKGGAITAGHEVTALYALVLRTSERQTQRLATVDVRWTDPVTNRSQEIAWDVNRSDLVRDFASTDRHFKLDSLVAATAEVLRGSPWVPGYRIQDLRGEAAEISGQLPESAQTTDFLQMLDQLSRISE